MQKPTDVLWEECGAGRGHFLVALLLCLQDPRTSWQSVLTSSPHSTARGAPADRSRVDPGLLPLARACGPHPPMVKLVCLEAGAALGLALHPWRESVGRAWRPWPLPAFHLRRFSTCACARVDFQGELSKENEVLRVRGERIEEGVEVAAPDPHYCQSLLNGIRTSRPASPLGRRRT